MVINNRNSREVLLLAQGGVAWDSSQEEAPTMLSPSITVEVVGVDLVDLVDLVAMVPTEVEMDLIKEAEMDLIKAAEMDIIKAAEREVIKAAEREVIKVSKSSLYFTESVSCLYCLNFIFVDYISMLLFISPGLKGFFTTYLLYCT